MLLCCAGLASIAALGQSLSVIKNGETNYTVTGSAPQNTPSLLEASANFHLWVGIQDQIQNTFSTRADRAGIAPRFSGDWQLFYRLAPSPPTPPPIRVMLTGDSMTADCCGWGQGMYGYFNANATVVNYATPNSSTKSFLRSAEFEKMLVLKPDYVLIQYGVVDQAWGPDLAPDYYTTLDEFGTNLTTIVNTVRSFNGIPILITVHSGRVWDTNGVVIPSWQDRNAVIKSVAAELQTPLIDLSQLSMNLFNELGPNGCDFMHWAGGTPDDVMHLSPLGAQYIAQLVVNALPDSLGPYLTGIFEPPPPPPPPTSP
jgi:lysophospholipase L1-like esterase